MSNLIEKAKRGMPLTDIPIIDAHGHLGFWSNFHIPYNDAEGMLEAMDYLGIDKVCISAHLSIGPDYKLGNDMVAETVAKYPDRFIGYATVNPNYPEELAKELERCFTHLRMKAIKLHSSMHNYSTDGPNYQPVWKYAEDRNCPVLIHVKNWSNFDNLDKLAQEHPKVNFILAHAGNSSGPDVERVVDLAKRSPNIYLDLTGSVISFGLIEYFVEEVQADRVIYGSDIPFIDASPQLGRVIFSKISPEDKQKILGLNILKLLRLET